MRIKIKMDASRVSATKHITIDDLGLFEGQWEAMTQHEKDMIIQSYVNELNDQPYWVFDNYEEL